jgi:hypothetical protein
MDQLKYKKLITNIPPEVYESKHKLIMYFAECILDCFFQVRVAGCTSMSKISGIEASSLDLIFQDNESFELFTKNMSDQFNKNFIKQTQKYKHYFFNSCLLKIKTFTIKINVLISGDCVIHGIKFASEYVSIFGANFIEDVIMNTTSVYLLHSLPNVDALTNLKNKKLTPFPVRDRANIEYQLFLSKYGISGTINAGILNSKIKILYESFIRRKEGYLVDDSTNDYFVTCEVNSLKLMFNNILNDDCANIIMKYALCMTFNKTDICAGCHYILHDNDIPFAKPACKCINPLRFKYGSSPNGLYDFGIASRNFIRYSGIYHVSCFALIVARQKEINKCDTCGEVILL